MFEKIVMRLALLAIALFILAELAIVVRAFFPQEEW